MNLRGVSREELMALIPFPVRALPTQFSNPAWPLLGYGQSRVGGPGSFRESESAFTSWIVILIKKLTSVSLSFSVCRSWGMLVL